MLASGVNVYNMCDVDYYLRALSKATSNVSGAANQLVNIYYRTGETAVYNDLATAFKNNDMTLASAKIGEFVKDFLMTEIPVTSETEENHQPVGQLM